MKTIVYKEYEASSVLNVHKHVRARATHGPLNSIAGTIKLNDVAASITPAEKPSMTSSNLSEIRLVNNTGKAPAPVANPANKLQMTPN